MATKLDKCLEKVQSRFALATVATKRWEQLMQGARPMVEVPNMKSMNAVFREIETDKLVLNMTDKTIEKHGVPIPAPPEPPPQPVAPIEGEDTPPGEAA